MSAVPRPGRASPCSTIKEWANKHVAGSVFANFLIKQGLPIDQHMLQAFVAVR